MPEELQAALEQAPKLLAKWHTLPINRKRGYAYIVQNAKRLETKKKRIQKILAEMRLKRNYSTLLRWRRRT